MRHGDTSIQMFDDEGNLVSLTIKPDSVRVAYVPGEVFVTIYSGDEFFEAMKDMAMRGEK